MPKWLDMKCAPRDGSNILLLTNTGVVSAWYKPGSWSDDTPISPREYDGPVWICYDDAFQIEIEELPDGEHAPEIKGWLPLMIVNVRVKNEHQFTIIGE